MTKSPHRKRKLAPEVIELIKDMAWKGHTIHEILKVTGVSYQSVKRYSSLHPSIGTH